MNGLTEREQWLMHVAHTAGFSLAAAEKPEEGSFEEFMQTLCSDTLQMTRAAFFALRAPPAPSLLTVAEREALESAMRHVGAVQSVLLRIAGYASGSRTEAIARYLLAADARLRGLV